MKKPRVIFYVILPKISAIVSQIRIGKGDLPRAAARSSLRKSHRLFLRALRTPTALGKTEEPSLCLYCRGH